MELNRQELYEYMDDVAENIRNKTSDEQNKLVLEKIEKVFEYMKEKSTIGVRITPDDCYLTHRQITTLLNSLKALDNNDILDSYYEIVDFVYDYGNTARPVLLSIEQEVLETQLNRIADKIKNII